MRTSKTAIIEDVYLKSEKDGVKMTREQIRNVYDGIVNSIQKSLSQGDTVEVRGLGTFDTRFNKKRTARNPKTGEPVKIEAHSVPVFRPGLELKNLVRKVKK